jgi:PKD repeat protein
MRKLYILILLAFSINALHSQTILFEENFEGLTNAFSLNTIDEGGTTSGKNIWVVNNSYLGGDVNVLCPIPSTVTLTATPDQPISITSNPQSSYLHITSQDGLNSSVDNCHFAAADFLGCTPPENYFARMSSSISTLGQSNVEVSFWWLCSGASGAAYGEVYYSSDNGLTWFTLGIINEYANQSNWIQTTIQNSVLDNQASLMIGFNFVNTSNLFASPTDPAFGIDDFQISSTSLINTINTDPIISGPYCPGQPISVPFSTSGTFSSSNVYTAELSNSFGLFTSPIPIGSLNGSAISGVINAVIPFGTAPGTLYQIRVVASSPSTIGSPSPVNIEVTGSPTASISPVSYSSICAGGVAFLFFEGSAGQIQWSSSTDNVNFTPILGANNATLSTDPLTQTTYFLVSVTNNCGTTTTSQSWAVTLISVVNIPLTYSPDALNLCNGPVTVSVVGDFFDLVWSNQQTGTSVIVVSAASTVSVVGTDIDGCPAVSDPLVFIETIPATLSISPASPITICSDPATLTASSGFVTYAWSDGEVGVSNSVNSPGSYSVTATDAQGCIVSSSPVIVQTGSSVVIPVSSSISYICDNVPATLTAGPGFFNYVWDNGALGQQITVSIEDEYTVNATDANGCPGESAPIQVSQSQFPVANFSYTQTSGYTISFDNNSQNGSEYEWTFGDLGTSPLANPSFTFPDSGPYPITLISSNPCSSDTITKIIIVSFVGIQDIDKSANFSVSPNPSSGDFILTQSETSSSISGLTLRDISGRVVYQNTQEIKGFSNFILPASNLPAGMYFLHFETLKGTVNIRLLKN